MASLKEMAERLEARGGDPFVYPELGWEIADNGLYRRYHTAIQAAYNPYSDIDWSKIDPDRFSDEEKIAVRYFWSRQALFEYQLVLTIVRALEEAITNGYPTEIKQLLMMHLRDEWWHVAMPAEYAGRLGGLMRPLSGLLEKHKELYNERSSIIGKRIQVMFTSISTGELSNTLALYVPLSEGKDPVSRDVFSHIHSDESRHARSNFIWATKDGFSDEEKAFLEKYIPKQFARQARFFAFGYLDLPPDEQDFHVECMKIAKDVGVTLWDAEGYVKRIKPALKNCRNILDDVGLTPDFSELEKF